MPDAAPLIRPVAFTDAVRKLNDKLPVTSALKSREWSALPAELRERAFFSARVENARFLQAARDTLDAFMTGAVEETAGGKALKAGGREDFVVKMRAMMEAQGMPVVGPGVGGVVEPTSVGRLRLIFETQTKMAESYASFKLDNEDATQRRAFPAWRFVRIAGHGSALLRPRHVDHTGEVRLKTDTAFWLAMNASEIGGFGVPWGPWGFNSGMAVEKVGRSEAVRLGLMKADDPPPPPVPEGGFNAGSSASVDGLDDDIISRLERATGGKVVTEGGKMRIRQPKPKEEKSPAMPPMSAHFALIGRPDKALAEEFRSTLNAIDSVHGDGDMPDISVRMTAEKFKGTFGEAIYGEKKITVWKNPYCGTGNTVAHEIGHHIHWAAFNHTRLDDQFERHPVLGEFFRAVASTKYYSRLVAKYGKAGYESSMREIWARSYAQFVAMRSGDPRLLKDLEAKIIVMPYYKIPDDEWAGVESAIEYALKKKGWMK